MSARAPRHDAPRPLSEKRRAVLQAVKAAGSFGATVNAVACRVDCSTRAARAHLEALEDAGMLRRVGSVGRLYDLTEAGFAALEGT